MDEIFPAALSAIQSSVNQNNSWSAEQAKKQMDFQREMSNTAHQREVADLKASGLNPVLSARLGGASTPSGASVSADTSGTSGLASLFSELMRETAEASAAGAASGSARGYLQALEQDPETVPTNVIEYLDKNGIATTGLTGSSTYKLADVGKAVYEFGRDFGGVFGAGAKAAGNLLQKLSDPYEKHVTPLLSKLAGKIVQSQRESKSRDYDVSVMAYRR